MKTPFWYSALRAVVMFSVRIFFRRIDISGAEHIPETDPVIFTPNHQNSFMDALVILYGTRLSPYFLARADVFRAPFFARLLGSLHLLPIYRKRDGHREVARNHEVFDRCKALLAGGDSLMIFPEANHHASYALRPLQKGFARLALEAAAQAQPGQAYWIVPVGITYGNFPRFRQDLYVIFGEPISLLAYREAFQDHPQEAILRLREELEGRLRPLVIDQQPPERYVVLEKLRRILRPVVAERLAVDARRPAGAFRTDQSTLKSLETMGHSDFKKLSFALFNYEAALKKAGLSLSISLTPWPLPRWRRSLVSWILLLPLALYGWVMHVGVVSLILWVIKEKIKDPGFIAPIKMLLGLVLVPLFYLIQTSIVLFVSGSWLWGIFYLLSLPLGAWAWITARTLGKGLREQGQVRRLTLREPQLYAEIRQWYSMLQRSTHNAT